MEGDTAQPVIGLNVRTTESVGAGAGQALQPRIWPPVFQRWPVWLGR
jgi:hypothetical protein